MSVPVRSLLLASALSACGGDPATSGNGGVSLALTGTQGEAVEVFEVDVADVVFTKLDGSTVSLLGSAVRVDFARLQSLSEMVASTDLQAGLYTGVTLNLDFGNALVCLEEQSTPARVHGMDGTPLSGIVPVAVAFAAGARPQILAGRHHLYVLDLDLDQALVVDPTANEVTFCPVVSASIDPGTDNPVAAAGTLVSVDCDAATLMLEKVAVDGSAIDVFEVRIAPATAFQIDGASFQGADGLSRLQAASATRVFVLGIVDPIERMLDALTVEAGAGTAGNGQDWVMGHVVARDEAPGGGTRLTVLGRSAGALGTRAFNTPHTVYTMAATTKVLRRGLARQLDTAAIQVGQLVAVFGELSDTTLDATGPAGIVRMLPTSVYGVAAGAPVDGALTLAVRRFDLRDVSCFDFAVTGAAQANPAAYVVQVEGLSTGDVVEGSSVRCSGWLDLPGSASDPDFRALSLVNHSVQGQVLSCHWAPGETSALAEITATGLRVDVAHALQSAAGDRFAPVPLSTTPMPTLMPLLRLGMYRIVQGSKVEVHITFEGYARALKARMGAGESILRVAALGRYDASAQTFGALVATVIVE